MGDSLGEYFQRAREAKGLTVDEAAVIRKFDESGGQFYAKRAERETLRQQLEEEERRKKVNRNTVVGVVGVALLLLFVLIGRDRDRSERLPDLEPLPSASQQVPAPTPAPAEPAEPPSEPAPRLAPGPVEVERNFSSVLPLEGIAPDERKKMVLDVEAIERCWAKVQTDRAAPQEVLLNPGDRVRWKAQERMALTLGNAGGVRVMLNGKLQGPFGARGQVVREIVFTP